VTAPALAVPQPDAEAAYAPNIDRTATVIQGVPTQAVQGPPTQQVSRPAQTTYIPLATPPPAAAGVPASYPMAMRYRPAPVHHRHHGGFRH
jgi:hypothetical protein